MEGRLVHEFRGCIELDDKLSVAELLVLCRMEGPGPTWHFRQEIELIEDEEKVFVDGVSCTVRMTGDTYFYSV